MDGVKIVWQSFAAMWGTLLSHDRFSSRRGSGVYFQLFPNPLRDDP